VGYSLKRRRKETKHRSQNLIARAVWLLSFPQRRKIQGRRDGPGHAARVGSYDISCGDGKKKRGRIMVALWRKKEKRRL